MEHLGTVRLETQRLVLRRFERGDTQNMYNNWAGDGEVTKFLVWPAHKSADVSKEYIEFVIENYDKDPAYYEWGIELKETGQVIGSIGVVSRNDNVGSVHIGYCIGRAYWNKGITSEAFQEVIRYLFEEVGANRIESRHDPRNIYSGRVMERCGLIYEGTLRQSDKNNQGICDAAWYGLLREMRQEK